MIIGALAVYTGPKSSFNITLLWWWNRRNYRLLAWYLNRWDCSDTTFSDNGARYDGKINGFNTQKQNLHDFTKKLHDERANHQAIYRGTYTKIFNRDTYFNLKYDSQTNDKILYVTALDSIEKIIY